MTRFCLGAWLCLASLTAVVHAAGRGGQLTLVVSDRDTGAPLACRMTLKNARGVAVREKNAPFWHDHFVFAGQITLTLPRGEYNFKIERGPEYLDRTGHFTINDYAEDTHAVDLKRIVDLSQEGWWSGDLFVDRPEKDLPLLMEADDVHVVQLIAATLGRPAVKGPAAQSKPLTTATKPAKPGPAATSAARRPGQPMAASDSSGGAWVSLPDERWYCRHGLADARAGNLILFCNVPSPLKLGGAAERGTADVGAAEGGTPASTLDDLVAQARRQPTSWIDAGRAFSWDLPLLVAEGQIDSIELANSHLARTSVVADEAGGKPRDKRLYGGESGIGRWGETIYYHLLNCGLRIPPSAGSGSGQAPNPVAYNRVYVKLDGEFSVEKWWEAFKAGRVVVTNGPLLRPTVEDEAPGHVFDVAAGEEREFEVGLTLSTCDPVDYLELVQDGEAVHMVKLEEWAEKKGHLPPLKFARSGWFLVRAVASAPGTYRFASSGPYYVNVGDQPRISRVSAQFFLDWVNERSRSAGASQDDATKQRHEAAKKFWQGLVDRANAE